jgi:DNA ligase (NAD+)
MDIPVDGLVICYEDNDYAQTGNVTGHHASRAGYAFKWQDVSAETTLKYVEWSCAASTISPVAVFEPVALEGTTVSRASLCNISEMERLGIGEDGKTTLDIIKANKIIPKCIGVKKKEGTFTIPEFCPVCHARTEIRISEHSGTKTLHCTNPDCTAKHVKKFSRFVSKPGMDIDGLSIQTMLKFMNLGYIHYFEDIYTLKNHADEIRSLDGFGEKSCNNMLQAIEKSKNVDPVHFIYALCIPQIGTDAGKKMIAALGTGGFFQKLHAGEGFEDIDGIGPERSTSMLDWYRQNQNRHTVAALEEILNIAEVEPKVTEGGTCEGLTFVITGDVHQFKNRTEFKEYVESQNGSVTGSVSKKTDYLVNNDIESTSSKNQKAKSLGIPIISEDMFVERFGK